jgi:streptogramin lyase
MVAALAVPAIAAEGDRDPFMLVEPGFALWQTDQSGSSFYRLDQASGTVETIELPGNGMDAAVSRMVVVVPEGQSIVVQRKSGLRDEIKVTLTIRRMDGKLMPQIETEVTPVHAAATDAKSKS